MDKLRMPTWLVDLANGRVPFRAQPRPWYRRTPPVQSPWIPAALMAPFLALLGWKAMSRLRDKHVDLS